MSAKPSLTPRQSQVLALIAEGQGNKQIAETLGIGVATVDKHVCWLLHRLEVHTRAAAVHKAYQLRILKVVKKRD